MKLDNAECGRRIKAARVAAGLTQEQAAAKLGVSRGSFAQYEIGRRVPSWATLWEMFEGLALEPAILFPEVVAARRPRKGAARAILAAVVPASARTPAAGGPARITVAEDDGEPD